MANTYLLSDGEYIKRFPASNTLDMSKYYTVVSIEQETTINDLLGDDLYTELFTQVESGSPDEVFLGLLDLMQTLLVYCASKALIDFKELSTDETSKDWRGLNLEGKINYIKAKTKRYITDNSELSSIVNSDDTYDGDAYDNQSIHFWV